MSWVIMLPSVSAEKTIGPSIKNPQDCYCLDPRAQESEMSIVMMTSF